MTEDDPDRLRQKAESYDRLAERVVDVRALEALRDMARDYRARADELSAAAAVAAGRVGPSR